MKGLTKEKIGMYTLPLLPGDKVYKYEGYTENALNCKLYILHAKRVDGLLGWRTNGTKENVEFHHKQMTDEQVDQWLVSKTSIYGEKFMLLHEQQAYASDFEAATDERPWWKLGYAKVVGTSGKQYKTPTRHVDTVRIAQTLRTLRPVMTPDNPAFTPYDRGAWERWQQSVHRFARMSFETSKVDEYGGHVFDVDEFFEIAGVGTATFDLAKFKVQGDEVA